MSNDINILDKIEIYYNFVNKLLFAKSKKGVVKMLIPNFTFSFLYFFFYLTCSIFTMCFSTSNKIYNRKVKEIIRFVSNLKKFEIFMKNPYYDTCLSTSASNLFKIKN